MYYFHADFVKDSTRQRNPWFFKDLGRRFHSGQEHQMEKVWLSAAWLHNNAAERRRHYLFVARNVLTGRDLPRQSHSHVKMR